MHFIHDIILTLFFLSSCVQWTWNITRRNQVFTSCQIKTTTKNPRFGGWAQKGQRGRWTIQGHKGMHEFRTVFSNKRTVKMPISANWSIKTTSLVSSSILFSHFSVKLGGRSMILFFYGVFNNYHRGQKALFNHLPFFLNLAFSGLSARLQV